MCKKPFMSPYTLQSSLVHNVTWDILLLLCSLTLGDFAPLSEMRGCATLPLVHVVLVIEYVVKAGVE